MATQFVTRLVQLAESEHDKFHLDDENDAKLGAEIKRFWTALGLEFPGVGTAWSAVFVSFLMKSAGATKTEFKFSSQHSQFVFAAIQNAKKEKGVFRAFPVDKRKPQLGDVIQNNRNGTKHDFAFASTHDDYPSHSAVVVEVGHDADGNYALTVGGNESDSIRHKRIPLNADGFIVQRKTNPFICVIQNLK